MIDRLHQDVRSALRSLAQRPAFTLIATLCLAVGISVNTAAFSLLNAIAFREFPGVQRQSELAGVVIGFTVEDDYTVVGDASPADWELLRSSVPAFSGIAAHGSVPLSLRVGGEARAVRGAIVSNSYFDVLGTRPAAGRFMTARDSARELENVVVISHALWVRAFDGRADIVGQSIDIGTARFAIIGVTPEGFFGVYPAEFIDPDFGAAELYLPLGAAASLRPVPRDRAPIEDRWLRIFGRLQPGATAAVAEAQASGVAAQLAAAYPAARRDAFARVQSGMGMARENSELLIGLLSVMVVPALILLIACANLANQQVARGIQRQREIALRLSLGASRSRVVGQLLVEAGVLAVAGSAVGLVLARWLLDAARAWYLPTPFAIAIDARVIAFTLAVAFVTALVFGLVPALGATRPDLTDALKDGASGGGYRRSRARSALVVVQIAASLAMIAVASVFGRVAERPSSPWLDELANRSVLVSLDLDLLGVSEPDGRVFQATLMDRLAQLPGVESVAMAPFSIFELLRSQPMTEPGQEGRPRHLKLAEVSGDWFDAMNTAAIRGRLFTDAEWNGPPTVAVVDEEIARYLWGDGEAIGRLLRIGADPEIASVTVIGVIPTRQLLGFREPEGVVVIPGARYHARTNVYVKTTGDARAMIAAVRDAVRAHDPRLPIVAVRTLADAAAVEAAPLISMSSGMAALGVLALALASLGLFGVLAFIVAQRKYEIGVRMALGAQHRDVVWMVVRQALGLGAAGVVAGTLLMLAAVTLLQAIIWGLEPLDPMVFAGTALTMLVVAAAASAIPARRAVSVDPVVSLRAE